MFPTHAGLSCVRFHFNEIKMLAITQPKHFAKIKADFDRIQEVFNSFDVHSNICLDSCDGPYQSTVRNSICDKANFLKRCADLEEQFLCVTFDYSIKRKITYFDQNRKENRVEQAPLVWRTALPAKPVTKINEFSSRTPIPVPEALVAMEKHKHLFDGIELWWVPKDILVEKLPDPDPILVGRVGRWHDSHNVDEYRKKYELAFFELHRWIDETVEEGWWSKEGY